VERLPHRATLGDRDAGDTAGWPHSLPVLTLLFGSAALICREDASLAWAWSRAS
jgi:hypothetical protein